MRYFYLAPETELKTIFTNGIKPNEKGEINVIVLRDDFVIDKFMFDLLAHEIHGLNVYCLFTVLLSGIDCEVEPTSIRHIFSGCMKVLRQKSVDPKYLAPYKYDANFESMGYEAGVFPVENKDKFTSDYKKKIFEYISALD